MKKFALLAGLFVFAPTPAPTAAPFSTPLTPLPVSKPTPAPSNAPFVVRFISAIAGVEQNNAEISPKASIFFFNLVVRY